jgi:hypothetical protein
MIILLTVHEENNVRITFRITKFLRVHEENHKDVTAVNLILNEKSGRRIYSTVKKRSRSVRALNYNEKIFLSYD